MDAYVPNDVLNVVRERCPGWAYAVVRKAIGADAPAPAPTRRLVLGDDDFMSWAQSRLPVVIKSNSGQTHVAGNVPELKLALRCMYLAGAQDVQAVTKDGSQSYPAVPMQNYAGTAHIVPPSGPARPLVAFVGLHPSPIDAARGEPFTGPDGACLVEQYLQPLNLQKKDVLLTYVNPALGCDDPMRAVEWTGWIQAELARRQPGLVIALGKQAKDALGPQAHFTLPHPSIVRKSDNPDQLLRRLKLVQARRTAMATELAKVHITKAQDEKRIVYGVVLDPYQYDSQGDYCPAAEIEATSHDYIANSRTINLQHATAADAVVVESWLWPYPSKADYENAMAGLPHKAYAAKFGTDTVHSGAWVMATKVLNDDTWQAIKDGKIQSYSIGGTGVRAPVPSDANSLPDVEFIDA